MTLWSREEAERLEKYLQERLAERSVDPEEAERLYRELKEMYLASKKLLTLAKALRALARA